MAPYIELKNVSCFTDDGRALFENADLTLESNQKALIIAPIASGKSVLIRLIAGLVKPDVGEVTVLGQDVGKLSAEELNVLRQKMGFVFHDNILISNLKTVENVALPLLYHSRLSYEDAMTKAVDLLGRTGFKGNYWGLPGLLPLYAKKEVAIARALVLKPKIVVCENLWDGLTAEEGAHVSRLLLDYHSSSEDNLLIVTALTDSEAELLKPDRIIRIEGNRIFQ
ncbi:MAG: ATP-binding cassette domain-containing protein [Deltaproteobacteria bacterium]|nr:ATP-binding cassette domain-containing protein [Deltaproteobacteria bacterium]